MTNAAQYALTGTTPPIFVQRTSTSEPIKVGSGYFLVRIVGAQAAFSGHIWERVKNLTITTQVSLNHRLLGDPVRSMQRSRAVKPGRAEQLGLSPNLINLVPAMMDRVSISVDFVLDKENRLESIVGLINTDAFVAAAGLAPGAAAVAKTVGSISQKLMQTFLGANNMEPILQFSGDFNIASEELKEGYYVIFGTRDEASPLPKPPYELEVRDSGLLSKGTEVTNISYLILEVRTTSSRTRALAEGAAWESRLRDAENIAGQVEGDPLMRDDERPKRWTDCVKAITEAQTLLIADPNYLPSESNSIIKSCFYQCARRILGPESVKIQEQGVSKVGTSQEFFGLTLSAATTVLGIDPNEDLEARVNDYAAQVGSSVAALEEIRKCGAI